MPLGVFGMPSLDKESSAYVADYGRFVGLLFDGAEDHLR